MVVAAGAGAATAAGGHHGNSKGHVVTDPERMPLDGLVKVGLCCRKVESAIGPSWAERNIAVTDHAIFLSKPESLSSVDHIPCHEVEDVYEAGELADITNHSCDSDKRGRFQSSHSMRSSTHSTYEDDPDETGKALVIATVENGHNSGRSTQLMFDNIEERDEWQQVLRKVRIVVLFSFGLSLVWGSQVLCQLVWQDTVSAQTSNFTDAG